MNTSRKSLLIALFLIFFNLKNVSANINESFYLDNHPNFSYEKTVTTNNSNQALKTNFTKDINVRPSNTKINNNFFASNNGYGLGTSASLNF